MTLWGHNYRRRPWFVSYGIALLAVAAGILSTSLLGTGAPVATFVLAVIFSAWFGGTRPGALAAALSVLALGYLLASNPASMGEGHRVTRLVYFVAIACFIVWVIASERSVAGFLRSARDDLRLVIDTIPTMAWIVLADGRLDFLNRRWLDYTGLSLEEGIARSAETIHPDDREAAFAKWRNVMSSGEPYEHEMRLRGAGGEYRWFLVRTVALRDASGKIIRWYGTSTDIEDRKCAEQALRESADRQQHLTHRLLEVQEQERRHISRELHDEFGQLLAAAKLHQHAAENLAGDAAHPDLRQAMALLDRAADHLRMLALELRPKMLETAGLEATLRWLAGEHQGRTGVPTEVVGRVNGVSGEAAIACFRVVQEALTNVVRHAHARHIWIELALIDGTFELTIRDDGVGFDAARVLEDPTGGVRLGLLGMRERMQVLGGTLRIDSKPGEGTRIAVRVPLAGTNPGERPV